MQTVWNDLRYAVRGLRTAPRFTVVVVATLALGIAANAVVFAVTKAVLLNPLPYANPDRLVTLVEADAHTTNPETVSYATAEDWKRRTAIFDHLSLWSDFAVRVLRNGRAEQLRGMRVTADFFDTLGIAMFAGRSFRPNEDTPAGRHVLILAYGTWKEQFGGDPTIVGRAIPTIDGSSTVVGILPPSFHPIHMSNPGELPRVFSPLGLDRAQQAGRSANWRTLRAIGRLAPGVTSRQAEAELNAVMHRLIREYPDYPEGALAIVTPLRNQLVGTFAGMLWMLQWSVLVLLILACANVAMALLARMVGRQTELAIRTALGADRAALMRQLLIECAVLAGAAGVAGVSLAWMATRFIAATADTNIPRIGELVPDTSMLLFGIAASGATTLLFGVAPGLLASARGGRRRWLSGWLLPSWHRRVQSPRCGPVAASLEAPRTRRCACSSQWK